MIANDNELEVARTKADQLRAALRRGQPAGEEAAVDPFRIAERNAAQGLLDDLELEIAAYVAGHKLYQLGRRTP